MTDNSLIEGILTDRPKSLETIYELYRDDFINWAIRKYACQIEDAKEIFQIAVIIFYENIKKGKIIALNSSLKTYLFAIGKNKILENHRKKEFLLGFDDTFEINLATVHEANFTEKQYEQVEIALGSIGQPCQGLLIGFYYQRLNLKELSERLDYKNEQSAKNQKYKCLKRLRALVFQA